MLNLPVHEHSMSLQMLILETPLDCKEIKPVSPRGNQPWILLEGLMLKLKLQHFGHLRAWERGDRGWDRWMASSTQWTWVWANSGRWWRAGKLGVLQFMGSQRVGQDWVTELNWKEEQITLHSSDLNCFLSVPSRKGTWFLTLFLGLGDENKTVLYQRLWGECSEGKWLSQGCLRISITELSKGQ